MVKCRGRAILIMQKIKESKSCSCMDEEDVE